MSRRATHYIYFLLRRGKPIYIGCSSDVETRLQVHKYSKPYTKVRTMGPYKKEFAFMNEARWIKKFRPVHNLGNDSAGRKKVDPKEKVVLVGFYIKNRFIEEIGGMENARVFAKASIEERYN